MKSGYAQKSEISCLMYRKTEFSSGFRVRRYRIPEGEESSRDCELLQRGRRSSFIGNSEFSTLRDTKSGTVVPFFS